MFEDDIPMLEISFHWPHHRFAIGYQRLEPKGDADYYSHELFFGIMTIMYNEV